jgi:hypothetical protein
MSEPRQTPHRAADGLRAEAGGRVIGHPRRKRRFYLAVGYAVERVAALGELTSDC